MGKKCSWVVNSLWVRITGPGYFLPPLGHLDQVKCLNLMKFQHGLE